MQFLALVLISLFSAPIVWAQTEQVESPPQVFQVVEDMPYLVDCGGAEDVKNCTLKQLAARMNHHLKYPRQAKKEKKEGLVLIRFVVNEEGRMQDISLVNDPGMGLGQEALRVVELMSDELAWEAGKKNGRKVRVQLTLPFRFRL